MPSFEFESEVLMTSWIAERKCSDGLSVAQIPRVV